MDIINKEDLDKERWVFDPHLGIHLITITQSQSVSHRSSSHCHWTIKAPFHTHFHLVCGFVYFLFSLFSKIRRLCMWWFILIVPLSRFQVHYGVRSPGTAKRLSSCKRKGGPLVEVGSKLHRRTSDVGRGCDPGMANKENELTCSDDVRGIHYNDNCGLPVNFAEASKMAGASSKYSEFTEVRSRVRKHAPEWFSDVGRKLIFMHLLSFCTAVKGPWSYDTCPLWKEPTTKSSPNTMAKKRQWISGLLIKVLSCVSQNTIVDS